MRKLRSFQVVGRAVQEVLDEFNERADEFGVTESDIVSVSAIQPTREVNIHTPEGKVKPNLEVIIVYWSDD